MAALTEADTNPRVQPLPVSLPGVRVLRQSLSRLVVLLRQLNGRYENVVVKDPEFISKVESALKLASYLVPGRIGGHWGVSELAYCVSNLYSLFNDYIVTKKCPAANPISKYSSLHQALLWLLTVLECVEVGVEVTAEQALSEPAKWGVVILLQLIKAALRSVLVFKLQNGLLVYPSVASPDRKKAQSLYSHSQSLDGQPLAWQAPRTGKVIRSVQADSSSVPYNELSHHLSPSPPLPPNPSRLGSLGAKQLIAEALYIARPLVHLFTMFGFNQKSWKPWLISLAMDLASLQLHGGLLQLKSVEKSEILRRRVVLLLYLLRSPFYNTYTKDILYAVLSFLSTIPLLHWILDPLLSYVPVWQQIYCYCWMS